MTPQYRGDGRLYGRTDASTSVRYRYDAGWNPLVETDASNHLRIVWFWGTLGVFETVAGVETLLASFPYASMTMDSWQTLAVQVRLDKLAVYHAPRGKAPRLLGGDIAVSTTMGTNALRLGVSGQSGFRFDNVSVHARSLDAAKSTTYAYNTSNQLTSSVTNGTTTTYTYDARGRLATRAQGSHAASYACRHGGRPSIRLVPKFYLGMPLGAKLRFAFPPLSPAARAPRRGNREAELRGQARSQVKLGNEGCEGNVTPQYRGDGRLYARPAASTSVRYRYDAGADEGQAPLR